MDNPYSSSASASATGRFHFQRHPTKSEANRQDVHAPQLSLFGSGTGGEHHLVHVKRERGSDDYDQHDDHDHTHTGTFAVPFSRPNVLSTSGGTGTGAGIGFGSSSRSSTSSASSSFESATSQRLRKHALMLYKSVTGHEPDAKALEDINVFVNAEPVKKNVGVEVRCMEKLKIHLIKQGRDNEARRIDELYNKLKGLSVLKNRESLIFLMYCLFDREPTRQIMSREKAAVAAAVAKHEPRQTVNGNDEYEPPASRSHYQDVDHTPIPRLHSSRDNLLNEDMNSGTKVPTLIKSPPKPEKQERTPWDLMNKLEDVNRVTEHSISKISKCGDETSRNHHHHPTQLMGSNPSIYSSTPLGPSPGTSGGRHKQFVNLRNVQENRMGSARSGLGGTTQTFGNMKNMERDLIRDIVFILQGIDGQYIKATPTGTYDFDKKLVIHPALRLQTLKLCELGYCYTLIRNYCDKPTAGLVAQGFKQSLEREMQEYYRLLAIIQAKIQQTIVDTPMSEDLPSSKKQCGDMSLLKLSIWLFECRPRLQVLSGMVNCCESKRGGELCSTIYDYSQHGDPLVSSLTVSLLSVICKPLYIMLSQWILYGELEDPHNEFFIAADPLCKREQLWHLKYKIRTNMLPSFISKKQAEKILAIGKNINFLKEICNNSQGFDGRYEIKALLETGEVESLFMGENSPIQYAIEMTYKTTSEKVLKVLIEDSNLLHHLKAIKKYLLLGQGDFIQYFLELIQDELSKPASKLYNHNISAILESAVRATNAQFENEDVLSRLDNRILPASDKDLGWDVFCLDYKVHGPIGTVLTEDVMTSYNKLFNGLWRTKRIELILSVLWKNQTVLFKYLRLIPELAPVLHRSQLLISEMIHFVHQTQYYIMFEATECAWEKLMEDVNKASDLDEVISSHNTFLRTIFKRSLLDGESRELLNQLRGIFDSVYELRSFLKEFNDRVEDEVKARKTLEPNTEEVQEAQRKFFSSYVMKAKGKIETLYTTTQDLVRTFLLVLNKQQDITLQCLSFRLDFNEYYHQKDSRLTLPLTFQHRRRSSAAFAAINMASSFTAVGESSPLASSSIQEISEC